MAVARAGSCCRGQALSREVGAHSYPGAWVQGRAAVYTAT